MSLDTSASTLDEEQVQLLLESSNPNSRDFLNPTMAQGLGQRLSRLERRVAMLRKAKERRKAVESRKQELNGMYICICMCIGLDPIESKFDSWK